MEQSVSPPSVQSPCSPPNGPEVVGNDGELHVLHLASNERLEQIPEEHRVLFGSMSGGTNWFHGRTRELAWLGSLFPSRSSRESGTTGAGNFAALVEGPAGSGKSALLTQFQDILRARGMAVLWLAPDDFVDESVLVRRIAGSTAWRQIVDDEKIRAGLHVRPFRTTRQLCTTGLSFEEACGSLPLISDVGAAEIWMTPERVAQLVSLEQALGIIAQAYARGFVVMVDECQEWREFLDRPSLHSNIHTVADPSKRRAAGIESGGLIVAGLDGSSEVLARLQLGRASTTRLAGLDVAAAASVLQTATDTEWTRDMPHPLHLLQRTWCPAVLKEFGTWPHHVQCQRRALEDIGLLLSIQGDDQSRFGSPQTLFEWARTQTAKSIETLYKRTRRNASTAIGRDGIRAVAQLVAHYDNCVPKAVMENSLKEHETTWCQRLGWDGLTATVHYGLLSEYMDEDEEGTETFGVPIPSMATWLTDLTSQP